MHRIKIVGVLRFSVLTPTYFADRFLSLEEAARQIFSKERMEFRFRVFENLGLPSLLRQSDSDFDCVILTAADMPAEYLDRLRALIDPLPNIHCRAVKPDKHYQLIKSAYDSVDVAGYSHRALFRLDDDDGVAINFISRLRALADGLVPLSAADQPTVIAFNSGFYVRMKDGGNEVFDSCERAPLSTGTSLVVPVGDHRNPYRYNHRALAQHFNTFSDISEPAFIRTIHSDNISNPTQMGLTHKMREKGMEKQLQHHFGVGLDTLKAL